MNELYKKSINRVIDYIQINLSKDLSLKRLSEVARYSEFHFNRVFHTAMGEPVYQFIKRLRLEKSAELLLTNPSKTITEIGMICGFATSSSFAKSFKNHFKMTATEWRDRSKNYFDKASTPIEIECGQISINKGSPVWTFDMEDSIRQIVIEDFPPLQVAYIRNVGPYQGDENLFKELYAKLFQWAAIHEPINDDVITLNIYHDNPEITDHDKLRVMAAIPITKPVDPSGSIGITKISGGKYGVCRFILKRDEFAEAWGWMFDSWLTSSAYERDNRECFEKCRGEKIINDIQFFDVEICIPVKMK